MTVQALQAQMGHREFVEWMAYYQMEPWDEPDEFMPRFGPEKTPPGGNWKTMQQRLRMAAAVNKNQKGDGVTDG
jgi:hypothetical protein